MGNVLNLDEGTFENEVLKSDVPVMVDFWAPWCGPCKMIAPVVEELAGEYAGKAKITKLNVDDNQNLAVKYGVMSIPTVIFFKDGNLIDRVVGYVPKNVLVDKLTKLL